MRKIMFTIILLAGGLFINAQDTTYKEFTGKYVFPDGSVVPDVEVILETSGLTMTSSAGSSSLIKLGVDSFQIVEFSGTAVFKRGDDKIVNGVHIEAMGYILDGNKVPGGWVFRSYYKPANKELYLARK